jgi:hypothetical protein
LSCVGVLSELMGFSLGKLEGVFDFPTNILDKQCRPQSTLINRAWSSILFVIAQDTMTLIYIFRETSDSN